MMITDLLSRWRATCLFQSETMCLHKKKNIKGLKGSALFYIVLMGLKGLGSLRVGFKLNRVGLGWVTLYNIPTYPYLSLPRLSNHFSSPDLDATRTLIGKKKQSTASTSVYSFVGTNLLNHHLSGSRSPNTN